MPEHRFESQSGSDRPAGSPPPGADRFWDGFGRARSGRPGGRRATPDGEGPGPAASTHQHECVEWCPICRTAEVVRATTPPEIREQWQGLQRDALVTVRAILDAYLERLEDGRRARATHVEDIPIE